MKWNIVGVISNKSNMNKFILIMNVLFRCGSLSTGCFYNIRWYWWSLLITVKSASSNSTGWNRLGMVVFPLWDLAGSFSNSRLSIAFMAYIFLWFMMHVFSANFSFEFDQVRNKRDWELLRIIFSKSYLWYLLKG